VVAGTGGGTPSSRSPMNAVRLPGLLITYISTLPRRTAELVTASAASFISVNASARTSSVPAPASSPATTAAEYAREIRAEASSRTSSLAGK
jgi:hypothetical protein